MNCLFCNGREKNYKPEPGIEYICSRCVILLGDADQGDLKRALAKAEEKGFYISQLNTGFDRNSNRHESARLSAWRC